MLLQILSDIHLEFGREDFSFPVKAPYLALLGDIGDPKTAVYQSFLVDQSKRFEKVFILIGNHENYRSSILETSQLIGRICSQFPDKLILLDKTRYDINDDVAILGCTLWSEISSQQKPTIECFLADFRQIDDWTVETNNETHKQHVNWLKSSLADVEKDEKVAVVLTHHAPTFHKTSSPQYDNSPLSSAFATNLDQMLKLPIVLFASAHTHHSFDQILNGVRLCSNQVGYPGELGTGYNPEFVVEVDD